MENKGQRARFSMRSTDRWLESSINKNQSQGPYTHLQAATDRTRRETWRGRKQTAMKTARKEGRSTKKNPKKKRLQRDHLKKQPKANEGERQRQRAKRKKKRGIRRRK